MRRIILIIVLFPMICYAQKPDGKALYAQHCQTCHQIDGAGAQNMVPPLIKTDYVLGDKTKLIKILLNGLSGEEMPSQAALKDSEIAAVLSYVRRSFGNKASTVTAVEVKKARATNNQKKHI